MPYTPKSHNEILRDLRAMTIGRTDLNDIQAGSVLNTLLSAFSHELASAERRIFNVREAFFLAGATGAELDERVAELPPAGISRLPATNASASTLKITRSEPYTSALTIPANSVVSTVAGIKYRTTSDVIIQAGDAEVENVQIVATNVGFSGNTSAGTISVIVSMPDEVIEITNTQPLSNGGDEESDDQLKQRAYNYLRSLSRCSTSSLEFLALSFISSNGDKMKFARIFENPETPSVSELVVDDGSGLDVESVSIEGTTTTGTVPTSGYRVLFHEAPATAPITTANLVVRNAGNVVSVSADQITSIPERGILYVAEGVLEAGYTWEISDYRVYTGFISELQSEIEGDVDNASVLTGFRASGTRCVVKIAEKQDFSCEVFLSADVGYLFDPIEVQVRTAIVDFVNNLAPSEPLYISDLIAQCKDVEGVRDIKFFAQNSSTRLENQFPSDPTHAIRTSSGLITITNASED
jgi:uncharacterized phage protein gp47/JayE